MTPPTRLRPLRALSAHAGSLRTTLALMALLGAVVAVHPGAWPLGVAIGLLALNLLAALVVHPKLRRELPLLVAHLALLALVALVGIGRLASLDGRFELTQGVPFDGRLIDRAAGPLYDETLARLEFRHEGFEIDYSPGRNRGPTRNRVVWRDGDGAEQRAVIGDHRPLVLDDHRFYTSPNKGFAPLLRWTPERGEPALGAVHLPSFPLLELKQSREWSLPDGRAVWVMLQFDDKLIDPAAAARFRLPEDHRLVVRVGEARQVLAPGHSMALEGGTLAYEGLATWMGYRVTYDPTLPWLVAASLLAALAFGWHYMLKFRAAPALASAPAGGAWGAGVADG